MMRVKTQVIIAVAMLQMSFSRGCCRVFKSVEPGSTEVVDVELAVKDNYSGILSSTHAVKPSPNGTLESLVFDFANNRSHIMSIEISLELLTEDVWNVVELAVGGNSTSSTFEININHSTKVAFTGVGIPHYQDVTNVKLAIAGGADYCSPYDGLFSTTGPSFGSDVNETLGSDVNETVQGREYSEPHQLQLYIAIIITSTLVFLMAALLFGLGATKLRKARMLKNISRKMSGNPSFKNSEGDDVYEVPQEMKFGSYVNHRHDSDADEYPGLEDNKEPLSPSNQEYYNF